MSALLRADATPDPGVDAASREHRLLQRSGELLGAGKLFKRPVRSRLEVHQAIVGGELPYAALIFLLARFDGLDEGDVVHVLGISTRTLRRQRDTPRRAMPANLASKAWLFAETLAKATEVFGGKAEAEAWMARPATGLDGQRPIEMLQTLQGAALVDDFLTRLEYDVYS